MKLRFKVLQIILGILVCLVIVILARAESHAQSFKIESYDNRKQSSLPLMTRTFIKVLVVEKVNINP